MNILHDTFEYEDSEELSDGIKLFNCKIVKDFGNFKEGETYSYINIYYDDEIVVAYVYSFNTEETSKETKFKLTPI